MVQNGTFGPFWPIFGTPLPCMLFLNVQFWGSKTRPNDFKRSQKGEFYYMFPITALMLSRYLYVLCTDRTLPAQTG